MAEGSSPNQTVCQAKRPEAQEVTSWAPNLNNLLTGTKSELEEALAGWLYDQVHDTDEKNLTFFMVKHEVYSHMLKYSFLKDFELTFHSQTLSVAYTLWLIQADFRET